MLAPDQQTDVHPGRARLDQLLAERAREERPCDELLDLFAQVVAGEIPANDVERWVAAAARDNWLAKDWLDAVEAEGSAADDDALG